MNREKILGIVRHVLTVAGGGLVTSGKFDATQWDTLVGAVIVVAGVLWSVFAPEKK